MFIDDLKKSLLQQAIQGKLVPQNPNDEPASELLKKIKEEKEKLIKEGKIKKEKALNPISDDEKTFDIPESWEWTKIEIITYPVGSKINQIQSKDLLIDGEIPAVSQGQNLIDGYYNDEGISISDLPLVMFGDHTRNVKYIDFKFVICADGTKFMKPIICSPRYVYYIVSYFASKIRNRGYARHYSLLKEERLPLPPLEEQKRIVAKLDELLPLLEESRPLEQELLTLEKDFPKKLRQSILQSAIKGLLVPQDANEEPASELLKKIKEEKEKLIKEGKIKKEKSLNPISDDEKPFDIPESWEWVRIEKVCNRIFAGGDKPEKFSKTETENLKIPVIANGETDNGLFGFTDIATVSEKSITVSGRGTIGFSVIRDYPYTPIVRLLVLIPSNFVDINYLKMSIQASLVVGNGSAIPQLTVPMISPIVIPLPPLEEQKRIVARVDELMKMCDELEEMMK